VENLEVDREKLGLLDLLVVLQVEVEEKMEVRKRLRMETPKPHLWTSALGPVATVVAYPF